MKKFISALVAVLIVAVIFESWRFTRPAQTSPSPMARNTSTPLSPTNATAPVQTNVETFAAWVRNAQAAPAFTPAQIGEGRRLAEARRSSMLQLMRENPRGALEQSLKWNEWAALPAKIRALVEEPFSQTVEFSMVPDCRPPNAETTPWQTHRVQMNGEWLDAFVFGKRAHAGTRNGLPVQGIRLGSQVALWDSSVLPLEGAELAAAQTILPDGNERTRSWLTGQSINGAPQAALVGGRIQYFANAEEMQQVAGVIAEAEMQPGPYNVVAAMAAASSSDGTFNIKVFTEKASLAKSTWTETAKRVLLMRVDFTPASANPYTPAALQAEFLGASNTIREMSYAKTWTINTMVSTLISFPNSQSYWETNASGSDGMMDYAKSRLASLGHNTNGYDIFVLSMPSMQRYVPRAAFAQAGGQHLWINGGPWGASVPTHELGHNYGYIHANYWRASSGAGFLGHTNGTGGTFEHVEYGDLFDIMGDAYGSYPQGHYNMQAKALFNWIEPTEVINVTTSGVYRVRRFDHINARQLAGAKLALQVRNGLGDNFWIGYRRAPTNAIYAAALTGAYVVWANTPQEHRVIDTTPLSVPNGSPDSEVLDAPLQVGQSWADPSGTLRITTVAMGGAAPNEYVDVAIDLDVPSPVYQLFTTSAMTTHGLMGSYVNTSLRSRIAQEDWRSTAGVTISGTRIDTAINFPDTGWGVRAPVGITGGSDADWETFSVQWDGWLLVNRATKFATRSDDSSRMWIDLNNDGVFAAAAPEFINNNWGNGQGPTLGEVSATVPPGLYRIRIQYEEGVGGNMCQLVTSPAEFDLFADSTLRTNGLIGSYVNSDLHNYSPQDDWRTTQTISGKRRDVYPLFMNNTDWGSRASVGLTGGSDADWDNYSVQWDGWIRINVPTRLATVSSDSSRMWIDVNGNGSFAATAPEFINNHWGTVQYDTYGETSAVINPGTYRIRIQFQSTVGINHFGLLGDPQETPGPAGYALYFDGVNDYIEVPNAGLSMPTNEITIEFWQRTYEARNQSTFCMIPDQLNNRVNAHIPWSNSGVYWDFGDYAGAGRLSYTPPQSLIGVWNHFALVSSRAGNYQRIYRNGILEASDGTTMSFTRYAAALRIGGNSASEFFKGELDEFRIWSVARTQSEIQNNMGCCLAPGQANLWAYWNFNEGTGTNVTDLSGNGHHGTTVNGAQWVASSIPKAQAVPEIAVFTGASTNAAFARTNNAGVHVFSDTVVGSSSAAQTFTIKNMGTANLTGLALTKTGANLNEFSVSALGAVTLAPQATTTFTVTFTPSSAGVRSAAINITSNDENENPFSIIVSGNGISAVPEIAVFDGTTTNAAAARVDNAGIYTFPNTPVGASNAAFFTIRNAGTANLTGLGLSEGGANPGDFSAGGLSVSSLAPNATATFWVAFEPTSSGTRTAVIQIASNDGDENPFRINVSGVGMSAAITQQPANTGACVGDVASFSVGTTGSGLTYQWQRRAPGTLTFSNISGAMAANYTTPATTAVDDGAGFRVLVSNGATNIASSEALLSVITLTSPSATYDFTGGNLAGGTVYGDASVVNDALVLTPAAPGKSGTFLLPALAPAERVRGFTARFKVQIAAGNGYADGLSFNWATDLPNGAITNAEEGAGSGLRICFDTFNNGGNEGPAIDAKWGTNLITSYHTDNNFLPGTNDFADVAIRLHSDGTLDVTYRCVPVFSRLPVPGYTPLIGARFGLGARTGGFYEIHGVDELAIELDSVVPSVDDSVPDALTIATSTNSPATETAAKAIDNDVTSKYLNFDKVNTGLTIPSFGQGPVRALTLMSANDAPERDPSSFVLEGSNDGTNFTRIASNAVPAFPARYFIQSFATANTNVFSSYRVLFPTVSNAATANSMQIAEVELLYWPDLTSSNDILNITLPPGAADVRGFASLFDHQLGGVQKLEVAPITNSATVVNITLAAGAKVLKGFEVIGAADDFIYPQRRPSSVTIAGSMDGINYTNLASVTPAAPSSNMQIQEFATTSNTLAFARYRITFGAPVGGDRLQVGEMRLFGEAAPLPPPTLSVRAAGNNVLLRWTDVPGYLLESKDSLSITTWAPVGAAPVLSNGVNTVTLPVSSNASFFRLRK